MEGCGRPRLEPTFAARVEKPQHLLGAKRPGPTALELAKVAHGFSGGCPSTHGGVGDASEGMDAG